MKKPFPLLLTFLASILLAVGPGATAEPPTPAAGTKPKQVPQYTIDQFLATTIYSGASFSPDGSKLLVSSNETGVFNAYAIPIRGGKPVRLTDSKVSAIRVLGYFPKDERFLYVSDQGGNEQTHLYVQSPDGSVRDLTPGEKVKAQFMGWSRDDKSFFFATNERDPTAFDIYEMTLDGYERKLLFKNEGGYLPGEVSPDRRYVTLAKEQTTTDSDIYLHDRTTGETTLLTPDDPAGSEVANAAEAFSPDSKSLYYTTDKGSEFSYLMRYDLATGQRAEVLRPEWDVVGAAFTHDGRYFVVAINNDARTEVRFFESAGMRPLALPAMPDADITGVRFSRDTKQMAFYAESSGPRNLFVRDMASGETRQLTRALNPAIDPDHLVAGRVVRFKSYDGVEIPGILYKPHGASPDNKVPALIWVHGGPGGQSRIGYNGFMQYLVNHGYAVYAINNRGSSGYGKTFFSMDDRKHGSADLDDCVASKKMLAETGWIDPGRIGIGGGSYGGYMVLAALAFRPREFAVGVNLYGVSNWVRTLQSTPAWWGPIRESLFKEMGNPETDLEYLRRISPLFHADKIERPLIVLQGANDPRVLKVESDEIVEAVRKKGVPVEYILFENEGHGFSRKETQEKAYEATLRFLDKHLKGMKGTEAPAR
ncbi:MAG TPA: S9 family peptidase [Thermoanaerobaculia bacterium]|nr:S9 family peptidase [Thermoanaerobaculia bacterium]